LLAARSKSNEIQIKFKSNQNSKSNQNQIERGTLDGPSAGLNLKGVQGIGNATTAASSQRKQETQLRDADSPRQTNSLP